MSDCADDIIDQLCGWQKPIRKALEHKLIDRNLVVALKDLILATILCASALVLQRAIEIHKVQVEYNGGGGDMLLQILLQKRLCLCDTCAKVINSVRRVGRWYL